jgi:hypothetical protein
VAAKDMIVTPVIFIDIVSFRFSETNEFNTWLLEVTFSSRPKNDM